MAIIWGSSYAFQKEFLNVLNPISFTFWSFFLSGTLFLIYALWKKIPLFYRLREGIILGIFLSGMEILETVGLTLTSSANIVFLTNIGMLIIPFVGFIFFKEKVKKEDYSAIILAICGMYFLVGGLHGFGAGEIIALFSAVASAFYFIYSERFEAEKSSHVTTLCIQQFFTIALVCLIWAFFSHDTFVVPQSALPELLWQVALFTAIPYAVIQWASHYADEMVAAIYDGVVEPLTGAIVSWVFFLEATTPTKIIGGVLMVFAFAFTALYSDRIFIKHAIRSLLGR